MSKEQEGRPRKSHVFNPQHKMSLDSKERLVWQNPAEIVEQLPLKPSYVVADLGCGTGYFTIPLSHKVTKVYGIDIQQEMLTALDQKIRQQKIGNIETMLSTENKIPLQNESVDLLLSVNTLHEFSDKDAIISEMKRVLRADGHAAIMDFKKEDTGFGPPVSIRLSEDEAKHLFEKNGLTMKKMHDHKHHYLLIFRKTGY